MLRFLYQAVLHLPVSSQSRYEYKEVLFLLHASQYSLPQCYMYYFISSSQDSQHHEIFQYLSLIKFLSTQVEDKSILLNMRIFNIYNYLRDLQLKTGDIPYRRKALFLFYKYSLFNFFPKYILRLLKLYTK